MSILARILSTLVYAGNAMILLLGLYGYMWRSRFVSGETAGPFWLFQAYDSGAPLLFYIAAVGTILFWIIRLLSRVAQAKPGVDSDRLFLALRLATILGGVAALPACDVTYQLLETKEFNSRQYHLVQVVDNNRVAYGVFRCQDVGSFYCQVVNNDNRPWTGFFPVPPPTPLPLPTVVVEIEGELVILEPRAPTPTPPAQFLVQSYDLHGVTEEELSVKIGDGLLGVDFVEINSTPEP